MTRERWKKCWQDKRSSQFTFIGSKDETFGNQTCTYDTDNNLRLRIIQRDETIYGKYITIPNITFGYGQEHIDKAKIPVKGFTRGKGKPMMYYRALTHKFIKKNGVWYLNTTVEVDTPGLQTVQDNGFIGIDFNAGFLAVAEVDRFGNYVNRFTVPFRAYHVSSEQAKQSLSEALKTVVAYATRKQKPIVRENLDFQQKKKQLKQMSKKQAKMLSGFAYATYGKMIDSKCGKAGVRITAVNPTYTSQIGCHKYMKKYGLSSHESAAMVIARKAMTFPDEKLPRKQLIGGDEKNILNKKRFQQWRELIKQWKRYTFRQKVYLLYKVC